MKEWLKSKAGWIVTALLAAIITQSVVFWRGQAEANIDSKSEMVLKQKKWFDSYCYTADATVNHVVTNGSVIVDYVIQKLPPGPFNHYELHAYIGNENGTIIANSQTNIHPAQVWGSSFYAKDWDDYSKVRFKGNGFKVPKHLVNGNYTVIVVMVFYDAHGNRHQCQLEPIPFKLNRDANYTIDS